jgi:hypothetical protein
MLQVNTTYLRSMHVSHCVCEFQSNSSHFSILPPILLLFPFSPFLFLSKMEEKSLKNIERSEKK